MESKLYKLGNTYLEICVPREMKIPANMGKFVVDCMPPGEKIQRKYRIEYTDEIQKLEAFFESQKVDGKEAQRDNLKVFQTREGEYRRNNLLGVAEAYAVSLIRNDGTAHAWADRTYKDWMQFDTVFVSMLALEKEMMHAGAMLLHSAFMCRNEEAILFSAPSGTGKSTQADLWEKYRGTRTVNGDRSLLIREDEGWRAYGWPICGSSEICNNENYPIRAIVMLKQAKENRVYPLKGILAIRELMAQITSNTWDPKFQNFVMDQMEALLKEVPIYCLECDISENAVQCLEAVLQSGGEDEAS